VIKKQTNSSTQLKAKLPYQYLNEAKEAIFNKIEEMKEEGIGNTHCKSSFTIQQ
jgi:hypothetical protein